MIEDNLIKKVKEAGFETIDDFVKANLHYLSEEKQRLFRSVADWDKNLYERKDSSKSYYPAVGCYSNNVY
jgi:hypothetical protein